MIAPSVSHTRARRKWEADAPQKPAAGASEELVLSLAQPLEQHLRQS